MALTYHAAFPKLGILRDELHVLVEEKVRAITGEDQLSKDLTDSIEKVKKLLGRQTNTGNQLSDQRCSSANENFQEAAALPDQRISPKKASSQNPKYRPNLRDSIHKEQDQLFLRLQRDLKLNDAEPGGGGYLMRNGANLTHTEMCNTLDEATKTFMTEGIPEDSITSGTNRLGEISKIFDSCNKILTGRLCLTETFGDDILSETDYHKWKKHVNVIASFAALMAVVGRWLHQ